MEHVVAPRRRPQRGTAALVAAGVALSAVVVWQSSDAAFTDTTANPADSWTSGRVEVADDQPGSVLLTQAAMSAGATGSRCLVVDYSGTRPASVRLHGAFDTTTDADADGVADGTELAPYVELAVQEGSGVQADCSDFAATSTLYGSQPAFDPTLTATSFATDVVDHAQGLGAWAPRAGASRTFRISWHLKDHEAAAGKDLALQLVWEAARAS